ncbi:MAG: hypothetical protein ACREV7_17570 [Steroidobacteraceae bacterium]
MYGIGHSLALALRVPVAVSRLILIESQTRHVREGHRAGYGDTVHAIQHYNGISFTEYGNRGHWVACGNTA